MVSYTIIKEWSIANLRPPPRQAGIDLALVRLLVKHPDQMDSVWSTGGLTDPGKTELYAEYLDGRWHRYTPDFVIRRKDGKHVDALDRRRPFLDLT